MKVFQLPQDIGEFRYTEDDSLDNFFIKLKTIKADKNSSNGIKKKNKRKEK